MCSAYKLKQGDDIQAWCTLFPIWNQSVVPCPVLTCFLTFTHISQEAGQVIWYSHLFNNFPQFVVIHIDKGFDIVNKAEVDVFLELSALSVIQRMLAIWSLVPLPFSKSSLDIWKFMVHVQLKPGLENFEHYFPSMWDECNCVVVWTFFGISFLRDWNENWPFLVLWPWLSFPNLLALLSAALSQHHLLGFGIAQLAFHHIH